MAGIRTLIVCAVAAVVLTACGGGRSLGPSPTQYGSYELPADLAAIPNAVPSKQPLSRYGNPDSYVVFGKRYTVLNTRRGFTQRGHASWYGPGFQGKRTSSGEPYDMYKMTAAHKTLPIPTFVRVTNLDNGRQVVVRINDRGPFHAGRIIDLSYVAAAKLGMVAKGTAPVEIKVLTPWNKTTPNTPAKTMHKPVQTAQPVAGSNNTWFLQVGAFANHANAVKMAARMEHRGLHKVFVTATGTITDLYRVRIGPLDSATASDMQRHLQRDGIAVNKLQSGGE